MFNFERYNEFQTRVINWNTAATNGRILDDLDSVNLQREVTLSEIRELESALAEDNLKEIMDGVCDVFVTASYLYVMRAGYTASILQPVHEPETLDVHRIITLIKDQVGFSSFGVEPQLVHKLLAWASVKFSKDSVEKSLLSVFDSNDSKFIPVEEWDDSEVEKINKKYEGKGFSRIVPVEGWLGDKKVYIMRADNGRGKILKPARFKEPNLVLTQD